MTAYPSNLDLIRRHQPASWSLLKLASAQRMVVLDEADDAIIATPRLAVASPSLRHLLGSLILSCEERRRGQRATRARSQRCRPPSGSRTVAAPPPA